jgi:hypothetical protein
MRNIRIDLLTTRVWSTLLCEVALLAHWDVVLSFDRSGKGAGEHDGHDAQGDLHVDGVDDGGRLKVWSLSRCLFDLCEGVKCECSWMLRVYFQGFADVQVLAVGLIRLWNTHTGHPRVTSASNAAGIVNNILCNLPFSIQASFVRLLFLGLPQGWLFATSNTPQSQPRSIQRVYMLVATIELLGSDLADLKPRVLDEVSCDETRASSRRHQILHYSLTLLMAVLRLSSTEYCGSMLRSACHVHGMFQHDILGCCRAVTF